MYLKNFEAGIDRGLATDKYFLRSVEVLEKEGLDPKVLMQVFCKKEGIVCGIEEVKEILEPYKHKGVKYYIAEEGSNVKPRVPVLYIEGSYRDFAHLETPIAGVLARRSLIATNTKKCVDAANGKPIIFMPARHDDFRVQPGDGYAAHIAGATSVTTKYNTEWLDEEPVGTMPHALIAAMGGDVAEATLAFHRHMSPKGVKTISLVDYNNNCVDDSVRTAKAMEAMFGKGSLFAVRLDTSENMIDECLKNEQPNRNYQNIRGVNPKLVWHVRNALDAAGFPDVKIVVSGGFSPTKITRFETLGVPVDGYGVGSSLLGHSKDKNLYNNMDFTADIVMRRDYHGHWQYQAKKGRKLVHNYEIDAPYW